MSFSWANSPSMDMPFSEKAQGLRASPNGHPAVCYGVDCRNGVLDEEKAHTIQAKPNGGFSYNCTPSVCYSIQGNVIDRETSQNGNGCSKDVSHVLNATDRHGVCYWTRQSHSLLVSGKCASALKCRDYKDFTDVIQEYSMEQNERKYVLRRLTPTECGRLQGFPDWWVDGAEGSDSAIYKMWGNGIALPCAADVIGRLAKELDKTI